MTLATVTVKTITTMTPDSRKDNNFHKDDKPRTSTKMIMKTTPTTASEDDRDDDGSRDPRLL